MKEDDVAALAADQGAYRRTGARADDEVASPDSERGPAVYDLGAVVDQGRRCDEAWGAYVGAPSTLAQRPACSETWCQFPGLTAVSRPVQGLVDRCVAHGHDRIRG